MTVTGGLVVNGARLFEPGLVTAPVASTAGNSAVVASVFLTQLQADLDALLNEGLRAADGDSAITAAVNAEILARYLPLYLSAGSGSAPPSITIIWLDPVSINLQSPGGLNLSYNLSNNALSNGIGSTFVSVGGNVEMIVMENAAGTFNLDVANVSATAEGGAVELSASGFSSEEFTAGLQGGATGFQLDLGGADAVASASSASSLTAAFASLTSGFTAITGGTLSGLFASPDPPGGATTAAVSTGSSAATAAASAAGQQVLSTSGQKVSEEPDDGTSSNSLTSVKSILQVVKKVLSGLSDVMNALGRTSPAAVLRQFNEMLDKLIRPAIPAAANVHGAQNDEFKDPGPGQIALVAIPGPAPESIPSLAPHSMPGPDAFNAVLWDHGIDGLLQERNRAGSAALWAVAFLASGLVGSELNERPAAGSPSPRKRRAKPRK